MAPRLQCNYFELQQEDSAGKDTLSAVGSACCSYVNKYANKFNTALRVNAHDWPTPDIVPIGGGVLTSNNSELVLPEIPKADLSICVVPDISQAGPEVAHIVHGARQQLILVTATQLPDRENERWGHFLKGVETITKGSEEVEGSSVYLPKKNQPMFKLSSGGDYNASIAGFLAIQDIQSIVNRSENTDRNVQNVILESISSKLWNVA